ncbi:MAG: hypothetical protein IPJ47_20975 [Anaerolineales bacterium]|nr:hypothetical protein [Anaerolineales bacterium]
MKTFRQHPVLILLVINLIIGLMTFRSYGLSWDEPLFYEYGASVTYAYNPANWFSGNFNIENAFGASASDHANRGPAYLLLAVPLISFLKWLSVDTASAWHLSNFLTFNLGVYLLYRLASKWMSREAALFVAALYAWQPLLWGHAFINPKDSVFMTFFIASVYTSFGMVEKLTETDSASNLLTSRQIFKIVLLPAILLGLATSIRILAPLAGLLAILYAILILKAKLFSRTNFIALTLFGVLALLFMVLAWPYLWIDPLHQFRQVLQLASEHPASIQVLFSGELYRAYDLPQNYLPKLLILTLTEPVLPLFFIGVLILVWKRKDWQALILILLWFAIPFLYVVLSQPPLSDNYRHFLFILPPIFIFAGIATDHIFGWLKTKWMVAVFSALLLLPGVYASISLHPYEYTYYNNLASAVNGNYETDYWLTCYREAVLKFEQVAPQNAQLFVRREPYIAAYYASPNITIRDFRSEEKNVQTGDYYLVNTRANEQLNFLKNDPALIEISRQGNVFCLIKQVP